MKRKNILAVLLAFVFVFASFTTVTAGDSVETDRQYSVLRVYDSETGALVSVEYFAWIICYDTILEPVDDVAETTDGYIPIMPLWTQAATVNLWPLNNGMSHLTSRTAVLRNTVSVTFTGDNGSGTARVQIAQTVGGGNPAVIFGVMTLSVGQILVAEVPALTNYQIHAWRMSGTSGALASFLMHN